MKILYVGTDIEIIQNFLGRFSTYAEPNRKQLKSKQKLLEVTHCMLHSLKIDRQFLWLFQSPGTKSYIGTNISRTIIDYVQTYWPKKFKSFQIDLGWYIYVDLYVVKNSE